MLLLLKFVFSGRRRWWSWSNVGIPVDDPGQARRQHARSGGGNPWARGGSKPFRERRPDTRGRTKVSRLHRAFTINPIFVVLSMFTSQIDVGTYAAHFCFEEMIVIATIHEGGPSKADRIEFFRCIRYASEDQGVRNHRVLRFHPSR